MFIQCVRDSSCVLSKARVARDTHRSGVQREINRAGEARSRCVRAAHSATISCRRFNVSIGQVDEHAGKNSIFLPDELLNHLGDGRLSEKNPYPFYLLSFIGHCLSGHQKIDRGEAKEGGSGGVGEKV